MSETKNKDDKKKNEREVYAVDYTKAGLASKNSESSDDDESGEREKTGSTENADSAENTPKISKEKSTERDGERPIH